MTPTHLTILRAIAQYQPVLKDELYRLLPIRLPSNGQYVDLNELRDGGYVQFERMKGPVWLTVRGREVIDEDRW